MAKVTVTIEDMPDGTVKIVSDPSVQSMIKMDLSGTHMTAAHGYAIKALNEIRKAAQDPSPILRVSIPGLKV